MNKVFAFGALLVGGWILVDLLVHPAGVQQLGNTTNSLLMTAGNQVSGVSPATGSGKRAPIG